MNKQELAKKYAETTIEKFYSSTLTEEALRGLVALAYMRGIDIGENRVVELLEAEHTKTIGNYSGIFTEGADIVDWLFAKLKGLR